MTTKQIAAAVGSVAVAVTAYMAWTVRSGVRGMYSNQYTTISASVPSRQGHADWLKRQGANLDAIYGADGVVGTSRQGTLADLIIRERRSGVRSIAMPYSSASTVTGGLASYNKAVVDSARIDAVISEIEPYNTGQYGQFYTTIRAVGTWCKANRVMHCVYMGWPSEAAWDSIVVNADRVYLHCYRPSASMSGSSQFGYCRTRLVTLAAKAKAVKKRVSVVIIYSCEPDFSYTYFQGNSWWKPIEDFKAAWNTSATSDMKQWLSVDGTMIFVSRYAKEINP